jgi:3-oxoacyl-[acyl-carrier protein] reductase
MLGLTPSALQGGGVCRQSAGRSVLVSSAFRNALPDEDREGLVSVGRYALRGLANAQDLFTVEAAMGPVTILVNNAGVTRDNLAMRMKDEEWEEVIRINLEAAFRLMRAATKPMMKARFGRIITITSVVGATGNPGQINYAASKAGMIGFTKSIAQELASRGITANCIAPGFIVSPMTDALNEGQKEAITKSIPAARLGQPDDIAAAVVYLASDQASYVTGQTLHVNGGMAMI